MSLVNGLDRFLYEAKFALNGKQALPAPSEPVFDGPTRAAFDRHIQSARVYVEYGSGGTTLLAAQSVPLVVSVESDNHYRKLVSRKLSEIASPSEVRVLPGRIGPTAHWGNPIFRTHRHAVSGRRYAFAPWDFLAKKNARADFVLIDGRYRVACTLTTLLHPLGEKALILLDDFAKREFYAPVLDFVDIVERVGRSLLLRRRPALNPKVCASTLKRHLRDWR